METKNIIKFFRPLPLNGSSSLSILLLRVVVGLAFILHGWVKIQNPTGWLGPDATTPGIFQFLAAIAEFGGGIALVLGIIVPIASLGIISTMVVAVLKLISQFNFPFVSNTGGGSFELPLTYLCISILIFAMGPGKYSLDYIIFGGRTKNNITSENE